MIEEIKNSIRSALYEANHNIIFHFEEVKHTGFPYAILSLKDFKTEAGARYDKQKCEFSFELTYMQSENNKVIELLEAQNLIQNALLPAINIKGKNITLDEVNFSVSGKQLIMKFKIIFYTYEEDKTESMETLDITMKENNNA